MTKQDDVRGISHAEYETRRAEYVRGAVTVRMGGMASANFYRSAPGLLTPQAREILTRRDLAMAESGLKFNVASGGWVSPAERVEAASQQAAPKSADNTPVDARTMTEAEYSIARAAILRGR